MALEAEAVNRLDSNLDATAAALAAVQVADCAHGHNLRQRRLLAQSPITVLQDRIIVDRVFGFEYISVAADFDP